jgi:uracil-DNA glycosylase family 4
MKRHELADCENCGLNTSESIFVPTLLPQGESNGIVLVGEAPGYQEARTGKPFTGPSGKLLDAVLRSHGIDRGQCTITNVCLCRPRDNRAPTKAEVACCSGRLLSDLKANASGGVICLGGTAASAIAGVEVKITSARVGPPKEVDTLPGVKVVNTFHPAYILRSADSFPQLVDDIGKLRADIGTSWQEPTYKVFDEPAEAVEAINELIGRLDTLGQRRLVLDIEVGTEKDTDFNHPDQYQMLCIGVGYEKGKVAVFGEEALKEDKVRRALQDLLEDPRARITAHNGKFDLAGIRPLGIHARLSFDTMLASYVLDERAGTHGLKYLAVEKLGAPQYDLEIHKGDSYGNIPRPILYKYNAFDVACTWDLQDMQEPEMASEDGLRELHDFLCLGSTLLQELEMGGIKVDTEYLANLHIQYEERMDGLKKSLHKWVDNPNSPKQVKEALAEMNIPVTSTSRDILEDLQKRVTGEDAEFLRLMLLWRREAKLYGTYIKGISKRLYHGRIHPSFLLHGTTTGRLACRNPNLQNVPRESTIRQMYVPDEGNLFVQADYKTIELRVVAALARDPDLAELLHPDRDIHSEIALRFFGEGFSKDQRVRAKAIVYGLTYGRSAWDLGQEFDMAPSEAQEYLDIFFSVIPTTVAWREEIMRSIVHDQEDLISPFGRRRRFWLITDDNRKDVLKEGLAFLPQSTASDINLAAAYEIQQKHGMNVKLLVHDSTMVECKEDEADDVALVMTEVMERTAIERFSDFVPFPVDVKIGKHWGEV